MALTIASPGVQINEIDLSANPSIPVGTNVLLAGFAPQGPTDQIITVNTMSDFEDIYGKPQTAAERYFYHTAAPLINSSATLQTYRLPYGSNLGTGFGSNYGALVYPVTAVDINYANGSNPNYGKAFTTLNASTSSVLYLIGKPTHFELTKDQYNSVQAGTNIQWSNTSQSTFTDISQFGNAGIVILNKGQTTINNNFEGYYIGLQDNSDLHPTTVYDSIRTVQTIAASAYYLNSYTLLPQTRLNFQLSSLSDNVSTSIINNQQGSSISFVLENSPTFNLDGAAYNDIIIMGVFKLSQTAYSPNSITLDYQFNENYIGSVDYWRQINSQQGGPAKSFFVENLDVNSPNVQIFINDNITHKYGQTWLNTTGNPTNIFRLITRDMRPQTVNSYLLTLSGAYGITNPNSAGGQVGLLAPTLSAAETYLGDTDALYPIGTFASTNAVNKDLGSIPTKLQRFINVAENTELVNIDLTVDGGLSTIFANSQYIASQPNLASTQTYFDDTIVVSSISGLYTSDPSNITADAQTYIQNWNQVFSQFLNLAKENRKDHLFIADLPRNLFIQSDNFKTLDDPNKNFSLNVYSPINNVISSVNSSYATTYANWVKVFDNNIGSYCWIPFSGFAAAAMANTDSTFQPWYAPAGFTRGQVNGIVDIALYPKQKQRDQLYRISTNPVAFFPGEGYVIYGQKTMRNQPSAFDRINVRRLFCNLEKATSQTVKYFVFEPNTTLTRTRVVNTLTPIFQNAKNTEGLYDYLIVCDERNNSPDIIDQNELVVDIYLKPVRTAEFILVNFYATRTSQSFSELIGGNATA